MYELVACDRHGNSPGGVLCRHIADGTAQVAVRIPPPPGEEGCDWLCDKCVVHPWYLQPGTGDLVTSCMHCARIGVERMEVWELADFARTHK
jgi:hypothetical protein